MTDVAWPVNATASSSIASYGGSSAQTAAYALSALSDRVDLIRADVSEMRNSAQMRELNALTSEKATRNVKSLLGELSTERGMSWSDIARVAGVSVAAVRKWRMGDGAAPEKRRTLAQVVAFIDMLGRYPIEDPVQWLEMQLTNSCSVTAMDLYQAGHWDLVLQYAETHQAEGVLDQFDPQWRGHFVERRQVVRASDGIESLVEVDEAADE
jgi:DNA-binding transcriptional regulator YiaG